MSANFWYEGLSVALVQVTAGEFAAAAVGTGTSPFRAVGRWLIDAMPTPLVDVGIALLRRADKPAIAAALLFLSLGAPTLAAQYGRTALILTVIAVGTIEVVALWRRVELDHAVASGIGLFAIAAGVGAVWIAPLVALGIAASLMAGTVFCRAAMNWRHRRLQAILPAPAQPAPPASVNTALPIPGISPLFTATEQFYVTDVTFPSPIVDRFRWRLAIGGLVHHEFTLNYDELLALPSVEVDAVLMCVHNPVGGPFVGNARWQGVPLSALLDRAGLSAHADHVRLHAVDGFTAGFQLRLLEQGYEPLLVYGMNGQPLTRTHGAPLRLLVPGIHGYDANIKWLQSIEVMQYQKALDYAERKGWPRDPSRVGPHCRIDVPGPFSNLMQGEQVIAGVAWSPPRGLVRVEFRLDSGTWQPCELAAPLGPSAWRHWRAYWRATPGRHLIEARAWGRDGVQSATSAPPFPHGAGGYHRVEITIDERRPPRAVEFARRLADEMHGRAELALSGLEAWRRNHPPAPPELPD